MEEKNTSGIGWVVYDIVMDRPYLPTLWATSEQAALDLENLLKPYPVDHLWRKRLFVRPCRSRGELFSVVFR
jgi:hypothetical protein